MALFSKKIITSALRFFLIIFLTTQISVFVEEFNIPTNFEIVITKTLYTIAWIFGAQLLIRLLRYWVWEGVMERTLQRKPPLLLVQLGNVLVIFFIFSGILAFVFDQSITSFWTASGAIGIVIGFALQNLILDTFSGLAIHMERPFKVGQWVTVHSRFGEYRGRVEETNWRTTRLWTSDRNIVIVPNSFITTTILTNYSMGNDDDTSRFELSFVLDYSIPTERAIRILTAALNNAILNRDFFARKQPNVQANNATPYGVEYKMRYFIKPDGASKAQSRDIIVANVMKHLNQAGITLSYPKTDLYMARMPWRQKSWEHPEDQVSQIAKLSIFNNLQHEDLSFIASKMEIRYCKRSEVIVSQDDKGNSMFILAEGLLEVLVKRSNQDALKVADLAPGTFFGEKSMLTGEVRSATVICATDVVICEITKSVMLELFKKNENIAEIISKAITIRDIENISALSDNGLEPVKQDIESETNIFLSKVKTFFRL